MVALVLTGMLAFGLYLQHVVGLEPCPMCIVQRYAMLAVILWSAIALVFPTVLIHRLSLVLTLLSSAFGAFVAALQSWLQWFTPEVQSCGRDFYGMIESFPLQRAIPMIFRGGGDCTKVDWTFLGGSIANWSFVVFSFLFVATGFQLFFIFKKSTQTFN
ncbi:MAG: disulfide bond formation protein B [Limnohabitans sp.]|nr:disulfide bond formation protein B [Limnohabitans sp.]